MAAPKKIQPSPKKPKTHFLIDKLIYLVGLGGVLVYLPQLLKILETKSAANLSLLSWFGFLLGSIIWFSYGYIHKDKPIMIINSALATIQALIVVAILIYH